MFSDFIHGFLVGMGASIPLGPIGILCIQRTLNKGKLSGFITGMGTAIADTFFAAVALFSLAFIKDWLNTNQDWVLLIGGFVVIFFGLRIFAANPVKQIRAKNAGNNRYWEDFFSSTLVTITNPGALFLILGVFALVGIDISAKSSGVAVASILWGVFLGGSAWWYILCSTINTFRKKFRLRQLLVINRVSGIIIMALGLISSFEGLAKLLFY